MRRSIGHSRSANARDSSSVYKRLAGFRTHHNEADLTAAPGSAQGGRGPGYCSSHEYSEVQRATVYNVTNFFGWVSTAASWRARFTLSEQATNAEV